MASKLRLVRARKSNLNEIAEIYFNEFSKQEKEWTRKTALGRARQALTLHPQMCFLAKHGNNTVGFLLAEVFNFASGKCIYLADIAVKLEFQEKGHGTQLLEIFLKKMKKLGFKEVFLNTAKRGRARKYYERVGFQQTKYIHMYKAL